MQTITNLIQHARRSFLEDKFLAVARVLGISVSIGTLILFFMLLSNPIRFGNSTENNSTKSKEPNVEITITPFLISAINSTIGQKAAN